MKGKLLMIDFNYCLQCIVHEIFLKLSSGLCEHIFAFIRPNLGFLRPHWTNYFGI